MGYTNGLDKESLLRHMFEEFPSVFGNPFAREMLENIVDYGTADNFSHTKNDLYYFLKDMIPEVEPKDLIPFMDKNMLTNEILSVLAENVPTQIELRQTAQHEWDVFVDDACVYAFDIDSENFVDMSLDELDVFIDNCVNAMQAELDADSQLSDEDLEYLKGLMFGTWEELTDGMRYVGSMEELKGYFEKNGWMVFDDLEDEWEIEKKTPLGFDYAVAIEHGGGVQRAIQSLKDYIEDFDPVDKAGLFIDDLGVRPSDALVRDMEAILEELEVLADGVGFFEANKEVDALIVEASQKSEDLAVRSNRCAVIRVFFDGEHVDNVFANFDDVDRVCDAILNSPFVDIEDNTGKRQWLKENGGKAAPVVTFEIEDDGLELYPEKNIGKD